jgi:hypothetical protein
MSPRESDKYLKLRANPRSGLGRIILYLQEDLRDTQNLAAQTLSSRFLPFVMDREEAQFKALALQCAEECEAWARAIRRYAGLPSEVSPASSLGVESETGEKSESVRGKKEREAKQEKGKSLIRDMGLDFS